MAPSQSRIEEIFSPLSIQGSQSRFFDHVDDNVNWTIPGHSPLSKNYTNKKDFIKSTLTFLADKVMEKPLVLKVTNIGGGGASDNDWVTVEMIAVDAKCKNGLVYDMSYCWVCQFDQHEKIVRVRAYLDTRLLTDAIEQNA